MQSIEHHTQTGKGAKPCGHRFRVIGAHALHAGHKSKGELPYRDQRLPIREVRTVKQCTRCGALRVSMSRHLVYNEHPRTTPGRTRNA